MLLIIYQVTTLLKNENTKSKQRNRKTKQETNALDANCLGGTEAVFVSVCLVNISGIKDAVESIANKLDSEEGENWLQ